MFVSTLLASTTTAVSDSRWRVRDPLVVKQRRFVGVSVGHKLLT
jgi:hypothetical protein